MRLLVSPAVRPKRASAEGTPSIVMESCAASLVTLISPRASTEAAPPDRLESAAFRSARLLDLVRRRAEGQWSWSRGYRS